MAAAKAQYHKRSDCRVCGGTRLTRFLELGPQPLANAFLTPEQVRAGGEEKFPLDVYVCNACWHVQLLDVVSKETLFSHYLYFSTVTKTMPAHFASFADEVTRERTKKGDFIIEIGSNDGILLSAFDPRERRILGVEPAKNVAEFARSTRAIPTMDRFWNVETAEQIVRDLGRAKVVISNNVLGHIDDLQGAAKAVATVLEEDGTWMWEVPYLVDFLEKDEFDTVYHEHLAYFGLHPAKTLLERAGLKLVDVKRFPIHGGTIRVYAKREGEPSQAVKDLLKKEKEMGLDTMAPYLAMGERVKKLRVDLQTMLKDLRAQGKRIAGYGAPAKGNTLLNYCGIGAETLAYVQDTTPVKQGLLTPGTHVPVVPPEVFQKDPPEVALMLAWNYEPEILKKEAEFRAKGGKFLIPIPTPRLV